MWWRLIGFFGSARALWTIIGLLTLAGGMYFKTQSDAKTILELKVSSLQDAIRIKEGHIDRLDQINLEKTEREVTNAIERQKVLDKFEEMKNEIQSVANYAVCAVPRELH